MRLRLKMSVHLSSMFKRSFASKDRAGKSARPAKSSFHDHAKQKMMQETMGNPKAEVCVSPRGRRRHTTNEIAAPLPVP